MPKRTPWTRIPRKRPSEGNASRRAVSMRAGRLPRERQDAEEHQDGCCNESHALSTLAPPASPEPLRGRAPLLYALTGSRRSIALRPYQLELVERVRAEYRTGARSVLLQLGTGGGKTHTAASLIALSVEKGIHITKAINRETGEVKSTKSGITRRIPIEPRATPAAAPSEGRTEGRPRFCGCRTTRTALSCSARTCATGGCEARGPIRRRRAPQARHLPRPPRDRHHLDGGPGRRPPAHQAARRALVVLDDRDATSARRRTCATASANRSLRCRLT